MIPFLYSASETTFSTACLARLVDCISCVVTEERNGVYECELVYPMTGRHYSDIEIGCYIGATHDDYGDAQPFKIYHRSAPLNGQVTFKARHLSYALSNIILSPFDANGVQDALTKIGTNSVNTNPFTFTSDKTTLAAFSVDQPSSVRSIMGGQEGSLLDIYGGEWEFDKFNVYLRANRGTNSGVTVRYGKNLIDLNQTIDAGGLYNSVVPFWRQEVDGVEVMVTLPEHIVSAPGVTDPVPVVLDMTMDFQSQPTENELRTAAQNYLTNNEPWIPPETLKVDFVALWQTLDFQDVANLLKLRLCDTVSVYYSALGVTAHNIKVIKTVFNTLADRYDSIELGQPQASFAQVITNTVDKNITQAQADDRGFFDDAITVATNLLSGASGGNVVIQRYPNGKPECILIMDTDDILTANNILKISLDGIGFSNDGGNTYTTAWVMNGNNYGLFYADAITGGTLKAITIQGPTNKTFWTLSDGEWQNHGTNYTVSAYDPATGTTVSFTLDLDVNIKDGRYKVLGEHDNLSSQYVDFGPAVQTVPETCFGMSFDWTQQPAEVKKYFPDPYVYTGLGVSGDSVGGYILTYFSHTVDGQTEYGYFGDQDGYGSYIPAGWYGPDEIKLGCSKEVVSPITVQDLEDAGFIDPVIIENYAPRNILHMRGGGWVGHEDSIEFEEYFEVIKDLNGDPTPEFTSNPFPRRYKPVWPYKPGDVITLGDVNVWGRTYSSRTKINLTIPISRPLSEYVKNVQFDNNAKITMRRADGSSALAATVINSDFRYALASPNGDLTINILAEIQSGTMGTTNSETLCCYFSEGTTLKLLGAVI